MGEKLINYRNKFEGIESKILLCNGESCIPINFDNAATTPPLCKAEKKLRDSIKKYGAIGRGKGPKSACCTEEYEGSRMDVLRFFNLEDKIDKYTVIYVKNTTEGLNLLANALSNKDDVVLVSRMEHHANDLPWRRYSNVEYVETDDSFRVRIEDIESKLRSLHGRVKFVSITAASNVTGYVNDINKIASLAHKYGAKIIVDAAQLVAHRPLNIRGNTEMEAIDYLVFSAHKMYAPFGTGVIIGLKEKLDKSNAFLNGGGSVELVLDSEVFLEKSPARFEAGTPNFFGVLSMKAAMEELTDIGFDKIEEHEFMLKDYLIQGLSKIKGVTIYGDNKYEDQIGVVIFNVEGMEHSYVAQRLADLRGISVRQGGFCAHPYIRRILNLTDEEIYKCYIDKGFMPGMIRASLGLYNTIEEVDIFLKYLEIVIRENKK